MKDSSRTKQALIEELISLRRRIQELEQSEADRRKHEEGLRSIADRERVEEELRKSDEKYRNILDNIEEGYYETDLAGNFTFFTSSLCRLLGYSKEEMTGLNYRAYMDAENAKTVFRAFHEVYVTGRPAKFESEMIRKDGTRLYNEDSVSLVVEPGQKPTGFRGIVRNVTERKMMEEVLENERNLLKNLIDNLPDRIYAKDSAGRFIICNEAMVRRMGKTSVNELVGKSDFDFLSPELAQRFHDDEQEILRTGTPLINREEPLTTEDGKITRWNLATKVPLLDKQGNRIGIVGMGREITDRKRMEEELRDSEERYRRIFEASSDAILLRRKDIIIFANPAAIKLFRANRPEDLMGKRYLDLVHPDDRALSAERIEKTVNEGWIASPREHRLLALDGQVLQVESTGVPVQYRGETHVFGIFRDIAERKRIEEQLRESEKRFRELSIIDDLTQLYNSRQFFFQLRMELDRSNRYRQPLTLLLLDLDNFKAFNDAYGHVEGDKVLQRLGRAVKRCLRKTDSAYRYGGEEFTFLLPMTTITDGVVTAERIRTEFKKETFSPAPGRDIHVTVSIGLAQYKAEEEMMAFVNRTDQLMYQAKKNGKDRVCSEP
ncbi:MAG: PAS domain S-box protein [Syntrophales bacterium]|nr:PAS domain S-box protein [Syntrophales bacterium]